MPESIKVPIGPGIISVVEDQKAFDGKEYKHFGCENWHEEKTPLGVSVLTAYDKNGNLVGAFPFTSIVGFVVACQPPPGDIYNFSQEPAV